MIRVEIGYFSVRAVRDHWAASLDAKDIEMIEVSPKSGHLTRYGVRATMTPEAAANVGLGYLDVYEIADAARGE